MNLIDWPALMRAGIGRNRLHPDFFWALTPAEFMLMLGIDTANAPLTRDRLDALAAAYPDERSDRQ